MPVELESEAVQRRLRHEALLSCRSFVIGEYFREELESAQQAVQSRDEDIDRIRLVIVD